MHRPFYSTPKIPIFAIIDIDEENSNAIAEETPQWLKALLIAPTITTWEELITELDAEASTMIL